MPSEQAFRSILLAIRAKLDLTQEQLAERLGVSFATVNRWEGGTIPQRAAREVIAALAVEAGVDAAAGSSTAESASSVTRRRRTGRGAVPTTKPMEQMLWDAACSIRGEKDAAKFKDYLLPLLFLKRLSDVFDDEIERLAEEYGDRKTALEIAEEDHELLRFYLPPEARWAVISGREQYEWPNDEQGRSTRPKDIGEHLTKAVRAVVRQNPSLTSVIDVVDFAAERNGERDVNPAKLREVVETFSDPRYRLGLADVQPDFLGRAYEYLLRKFAEGSGQSAGEFFTPTEVGFLMAHIMRPKPGEECHDYACGSAGLLVKLQLVAREFDPTSKVPLKLYGQELTGRELRRRADEWRSSTTWSVEMARGDTMINPKFRRQTARFAPSTSSSPIRCGTSRSIPTSSPTTRSTVSELRAAPPLARATGLGSNIPWPVSMTGAGRRWCSTPARYARLGIEERGQGTQHPQVVRRSRSDRRRDPSARQPLL